MEDLDFSGLLANCSDKGRTGYNPVLMYAVITYANMRGIRTIDRIVDLCERDIAFIWLTQGRKPKRLVFVRIFLFRSAGSKITYFPAVPIVFKVFISFSSYNKDILKLLRQSPL